MSNNLIEAKSENNGQFRATRVKCLNDNQVFASIHEAARYYKIWPSGVELVLAGKSYSYKNLRFEYLDRPTKKAKPRKRKLRNIETGEVFDSITSAAEKYNGTKQALTCYFRRKKEAKRKCTCFGFQWEIIEEVKNENEVDKLD